MSKVIIYKTDEGGVAVIRPSAGALAMTTTVQDWDTGVETVVTTTIEDIALKDVPAGKPFKIIEASELPQDRTFRDAWEVDEATLTDGVGAEHGN